MSWSTSELRVRLAPLNWFKPSSKIFYWPFQGGISFVDLLCFCSVLCLLCLCVRLIICALWSPAGKGLTCWLSFVVSNCESVPFPLVSWVRCGTWLYRFLIFALLLTLVYKELIIFITAYWKTSCWYLTLIFLLSADKLCKQFKTRSGLRECRSSSRSKQIDTLIVFLKPFFEEVNFEKSCRQQQKHV